ncbi:MAG: hypothetical protein ATN36_05990 [Epulopiscium sp. Nele67-Bin005]|nr:MAG: hypothetical protein ATN36_05990 [Epulopiscium sp. Nele67-Bin005]
MKKFLRKSLLTIFALTTFSLVGCGSNDTAQVSSNASTPSSNEQNITPYTDEERVIGLSVPLVNIMSELGINMVGVPDTKYTLDASTENLPKVGLSMSPDTEKILQLDPTHVIGLSTIRSMIEAPLSAGGIDPIYVNLENIDELKNTIETLGKLFNKQSEATALIADFDAKVTAVVEEAKLNEPVKVLILFGFPGNYMIATEASFVGQMADLLGAINVSGEEKIVYVQMNLEELLVQDPDVILRLAHGDQDVVIEMFDAEFETNIIWQEFSAVQNNNIYDLDDAMFNVSATLETPEALALLSEILYGN